MSSRWVHLKDSAIAARKNGDTLPSIENRFGIPRSTLSGWFRDIVIPLAAQKKIKARKEKALIEARKKSNKWHNEQKIARLQVAEQLAQIVIDQIPKDSPSHLEIALAFLYLGEGTKRKVELSLGNSNPKIVQFFVFAVKQLYGIPPEAATYYLHLRADQNSEDEKQYWSEILNVPKERFRKSIIDMRTKGHATYPTYHGVCIALYGKVALQRKLLYIADKFCERNSELLRA